VGLSAFARRGATLIIRRFVTRAGSALLGALYDISIPLLVAVSIAAELAALIPFMLATRVAKV